MALTQCPECSGQVSTTLGACPHCGFHLSWDHTQETPANGRSNDQGSAAKRLGEVGQRIKAAQNRKAYYSPEKNPAIVALIVALVLIVVTIGLCYSFFPELTREVLFSTPGSKKEISNAEFPPSSPGDNRFVRDTDSNGFSKRGAGGFFGLKVKPTDPQTPEEILDQKPAVKLPPVGYEDENYDFDQRQDKKTVQQGRITRLPEDPQKATEGFRLPDLDTDSTGLTIKPGGTANAGEEGLGEEDFGEEEDEGYFEVFSNGMALFEHGEYEELIELFQTFVLEELPVSFSVVDSGRREKLELWIQWTDFVAAVEKLSRGPKTRTSSKSTPSPADTGAGAKPPPREKEIIKLILANGSEIEGELVSRDPEKIVLRKGTTTSAHSRLDIEKEIFIRSAKPGSALPIEKPEWVEGNRRSLVEIAEGIDELTVDEVVYLYRMGTKVKSKAWVTSVLKKVPRENPEFVSSIFENLIQEKDGNFIRKLSFYIPNSHLRLAGNCKDRGLTREFDYHRKQYLNLRSRSTAKKANQEVCKGCKGAGETVCESCKGIGVKEVPSREFCSACNSQGALECETCDGRGEGPCSHCDGYGYRYVTRAVYSLTFAGSSRGTRTIRVACPKRGKCRRCRGKGQIKCSACKRSKTKKIKQECLACNVEGQAEQKEQLGLSECKKCAGGGLKINVEVYAPGPIFKGSMNDVLDGLRAIETARRNLTSLQYQFRRSSIWNKHTGEWILCAGQVFEARKPYSSYSTGGQRAQVQLKIFGVGKENDFITPYQYWVNTENLHFARTLGPGDYVLLWVPLDNSPGNFGFTSSVIVPLGPYENLKKASMR